MNATSVTGLDVEVIRKDFPILHQTVHGKPLAYLDNAATTQKPRVVIDAIRQYYESENANIHRGVHYLSERATADYERARSVVRAFLNARDSAEIIFVRGTTEAINLVAATYGRTHLQPGDEVLITAMEHHSNIVPWQMICEERGARLRVVPINDHGELIIEEFEKLLSARTRLAAITHVSNALGTVNPVQELVRLCHAHGVPVLIDGAQAVAHLRVDVQALGCDFYAFSGHKVYGPTGIGVLYGRKELLERMPPYQGGGDMIRSVSFERTLYADPPYRFEAGTPHIAGAIGLAAAIEYLTGLGIEQVHAWESQLVRYGVEQLAQIPGLRLIGTPRERAAVISFVLDGVHAHDVGTVLDLEGIAVRAGHHCAQPVMQRYGVPATVRASLAVYNRLEEIDRLVMAVRKAKELLG